LHLQYEFSWAQTYGLVFWTSFIPPELSLLERKKLKITLVSTYLHLFLFWNGNRYAAFPCLTFFFPFLHSWVRTCCAWRRSFLVLKQFPQWLSEFPQSTFLLRIQKIQKQALVYSRLASSSSSSSSSCKAKQWFAEWNFYNFPITSLYAASHLFSSTFSNTKKDMTATVLQTHLFYFPHEEPTFLSFSFQPWDHPLPPTLVDHLMFLLQKSNDLYFTEYNKHLTKQIYKVQDIFFMHSMPLSSWISFLHLKQKRKLEKKIAKTPTTPEEKAVAFINIFS
jgi:hypothetical protein